MKISGKDLPDGTKQQYKLSGKGRMNLETFWTQHVKDDTMFLEVRCAEGLDPRKDAQFEIDEVAAGFVQEDEDAAGIICGNPDFENAICYTGSTQCQRGRAVARLLANRISLCAGWLASSSNHLITNEHCLKSQADATNTDFEFLAEAPACGTPNCQLCHPGQFTISGANFLRANADLDCALVQFPNHNPAATCGFLEIDNRVGILNEQICMVSHPAGRAKEFVIRSSHPQDAGAGFCKLNSLFEPSCGAIVPSCGCKWFLFTRAFCHFQ